MSADKHVVYFELKNGSFGNFSSPDELEFVAGDVVLLTPEDQVLAVPKELWGDESVVVVVRRVLDNELVIETPSGIKVIPKQADLEVHEGNTVEYAESLGITRVIAPTPIRFRDSQGDEDLDVAKFRIDFDADGPTFADFGGNSSVVDRARELVSTQLAKKALLDAIGARPIRGVIFTGPPGTGKTMLARIIAAESGATFYLVSGPSIVSKWVGDSEELLRRIFEAASGEDQAIIFFDEIDSLAGQRGDQSHEASKRLVAQFLTLMDGFAHEGNVVVIAATNRIEDIDVALLRPGRFDWEIQFELPDRDDRLKILETSKRGLTVVEPLPLESVADLSDGWSPAKLASIWGEAGLVAATHDRGEIWDEDFASAYERVAARKNRGVLA